MLSAVADGLQVFDCDISPMPSEIFGDEPSVTVVGLVFAA
jgi:hypothetical protein